MTIRSRLLLPLSAIVLTCALAAPAAFAEDTMSKDSMSKDGMSKGTDSKMKSPTTGDHMSQTPDKSGTGGMKKDNMSDMKSHDVQEGTSK